jgi:CRP-like cAMP-binding protein
MPNAEEKRVLGLLRKTPLLSEVSTETLERLVAGARVESYRPRQVIYLPGDRSYGVHFLSQGRVKVSKVTRDGKELTLAYRTAGDFFGEGCLIDGGPREEMVESMEPTVSVELARDDFDTLLRNGSSLSYRVVRAFIERHRDLENKVEQLIFKDVGSKLAELLLRLGIEHGVESKKGVALAVKITHQEMANLIGSTRETVSLTLSQFKRKGFIATEGRRVILADQEGLRGLA